MLPLDLHVLGLPLAFILSQDQTLRCKNFEFCCYALSCISYAVSFFPNNVKELLLSNKHVSICLSLLLKNTRSCFGVQRYELILLVQTFVQKVLIFFLLTSLAFPVGSSKDTHLFHSRKCF